MLTQAHIIISGNVQGIGYRYFAKRLAVFFGIAGWIKNNIDGTVELEIEGEKDKIEQYIEKLKHEHPWVTISSVEIKWTQWSGKYLQFFVE